MITFRKDMPVTEREAMRGGPGKAVLTALTTNLPGNARLFSTITLKPGCGIGFHRHENETELFYFASGKGRVQDDDAFTDVTAGDSMTTPSGHGHAVTNTGDRDLVLVAVIIKD